MYFKNKLFLDNSTIDPVNYYHAKFAYKAINHPQRDLLMSLLEKHGTMTETDLQIKARIDDQSLIAQHLSKLRKYNFVHYHRNDDNLKFHYYSIHPTGPQNYQSFIDYLTGGDQSKAFAIFRALSHDFRMYLAQFIYNQRSTIVSNIYRRNNLEQSQVSQHLGILKNAGIIQAKRNGKFQHYSVNEKEVKRIDNIVVKYLKTISFLKNQTTAMKG